MKSLSGHMAGSKGQSPPYFFQIKNLFYLRWSSNLTAKLKSGLLLHELIYGLFLNMR